MGGQGGRPGLRDVVFKGFIRNGEVSVRKVGFERFVEVFADREPLFYGLVAIALSLFMGWLAGRLFNRG